MSLRLAVFLIIAACFISFSCRQDDSSSVHDATDTATNLSWLLADDWKAPDTSALAFDTKGNLIRYGRDLIANTASYFGPEGSVSRFANGMNCQNCHLDAGTKLFANSFSAVYSNYPRFRARSGSLEHLEKRINDCMERSMNGRKLDSLSREMRAMIAYINWVGKDVKKGTTPEGASVVDVPYLERAADPEKGKLAYGKHCTSCHGTEGEGKRNDIAAGYLYPPLWGDYSYNTGAGLFRLSRFTGFIKSNMPSLTSSYAHPLLTDEEAWDIAAFVNSMPRPEKTFASDWPDISKKPLDHPFGPYADSFSEAQHKLGPFKEIAASKKKK